MRPAGQRRLIFAWLYFTDGAPMGFLWWALPVHLASAGVPADQVASLLALLVLPWGLKLFWAPAIDLARSERFGTRHWIGCAQLAMAVSLAPLLVLDPLAQPTLLTLTLMAHGVAAATQDGAIDGLAIACIPPGERGAVNGWMQVGMLSARALFGGGAVVLIDQVGLPALVATLMVVLAGSALFVGRLPEDSLRPPSQGRAAPYLATLWDGLRRRSTWAGLVLALVAGAGFKSLTALSGPLLLERGASQVTISLFFSLGAVLCMAAGALLGGRLADGPNRTRAVALGEGLAALLVAGVAALVWHPPNGQVGWLLVLLCLLYLSIGVATSALYALFMDLTEPRAAVTQFCIFMAGINLCESWSTFSLGQLVADVGYGPGLLLMSAASLAALLALRWVRRSLPDDELPAHTGTR